MVLLYLDITGRTLAPPDRALLGTPAGIYDFLLAAVFGDDLPEPYLDALFIDLGGRANRRDGRDRLAWRAAEKARMAGRIGAMAEEERLMLAVLLLDRRIVAYQIDAVDYLSKLVARLVPRYARTVEPARLGSPALYDVPSAARVAAEVAERAEDVGFLIARMEEGRGAFAGDFDAVAERLAALAGKDRLETFSRLVDESWAGRFGAVKDEVVRLQALRQRMAIAIDRVVKDRWDRIRSWATVASLVVAVIVAFFRAELAAAGAVLRTLACEVLPLACP